MAPPALSMPPPPAARGVVGAYQQIAYDGACSSRSAVTDTTAEASPILAEESLVDVSIPREALNPIASNRRSGASPAERFGARDHFLRSNVRPALSVILLRRLARIARADVEDLDDAFASVAMLGELALLKIARCRPPP